MNRGQMKTLVKRHGFDDLDPLDDWVNAGMHEVEKEKPWDFLEDLVSAATTLGSNTMLAPPNTKTVISVKYTDATYSLDEITVSEFQRCVPLPLTSGRAQRFCVVGGPPSPELNFDRLMDQVYTLQFHVRYAEADLAADGDSPTYIPTTLHMAIVLRATAFGLSAENEEDRAAAKLQEYQDLINKTWSDIGQNTDSPKYVQDVMNYGGN